MRYLVLFIVWSFVSFAQDSSEIVNRAFSDDQLLFTDWEDFFGQQLQSDTPTSLAKPVSKSFQKKLDQGKKFANDYLETLRAEAGEASVNWIIDPYAEVIRAIKNFEFLQNKNEETKPRRQTIEMMARNLRSMKYPQADLPTHSELRKEADGFENELAVLLPEFLTERRRTLQKPDDALRELLKTLESRIEDLRAANFESAYRRSKKIQEAVDQKITERKIRNFGLVRFLQMPIGRWPEQSVFSKFKFGIDWRRLYQRAIDFLNHDQNPGHRGLRLRSTSEMISDPYFVLGFASFESEVVNLDSTIVREAMAREIQLIRLKEALRKMSESGALKSQDILSKLQAERLSAADDIAQTLTGDLQKFSKVVSSGGPVADLWWYGQSQSVDFWTQQSAKAKALGGSSIFKPKLEKSRPLPARLMAKITQTPILKAILIFASTVLGLKPIATLSMHDQIRPTADKIEVSIREAYAGGAHFLNAIPDKVKRTKTKNEGALDPGETFDGGRDSAISTNYLETKKERGISDSSQMLKAIYKFEYRPAFYDFLSLGTFENLLSGDKKAKILDWAPWSPAIEDPTKEKAKIQALAFHGPQFILPMPVNTRGGKAMSLLRIELTDEKGQSIPSNLVDIRETRGLPKMVSIKVLGSAKKVKFVAEYQLDDRQKSPTAPVEISKTEVERLAKLYRDEGFKVLGDRLQILSESGIRVPAFEIASAVSQSGFYVRQEIPGLPEFYSLENFSRETLRPFLRGGVFLGQCDEHNFLLDDVFNQAKDLEARDFISVPMAGFNVAAENLVAAHAVDTLVNPATQEIVWLDGTATKFNPLLGLATELLADDIAKSKPIEEASRDRFRMLETAYNPEDFILKAALLQALPEEPPFFSIDHLSGRQKLDRDSPMNQSDFARNLQWTHRSDEELLDIVAEVVDIDRNHYHAFYRFILADLDLPYEKIFEAVLKKSNRTLAYRMTTKLAWQDSEAAKRALIRLLNSKMNFSAPDIFSLPIGAFNHEQIREILRSIDLDQFEVKNLFIEILMDANESDFQSLLPELRRFIDHGPHSIPVQALIQARLNDPSALETLKKYDFSGGPENNQIIEATEAHCLKFSDLSELKNTNLASSFLRGIEQSLRPGNKIREWQSITDNAISTAVRQGKILDWSNTILINEIPVYISAVANIRGREFVIQLQNDPDHRVQLFAKLYLAKDWTPEGVRKLIHEIETSEDFSDTDRKEFFKRGSEWGVAEASEFYLRYFFKGPPPYVAGSFKKELMRAALDLPPPRLAHILAEIRKTMGDENMTQAFSNFFMWGGVLFDFKNLAEGRAKVLIDALPESMRRPAIRNAVSTFDALNRPGTGQLAWARKFHRLEKPKPPVVEIDPNFSKPVLPFELRKPKPPEKKIPPSEWIAIPQPRRKNVEESEVELPPVGLNPKEVQARNMILSKTKTEIVKILAREKYRSGQFSSRLPHEQLLEAMALIPEGHIWKNSDFYTRLNEIRGQYLLYLNEPKRIGSRESILLHDQEYRAMVLSSINQLLSVSAEPTQDQCKKMMAELVRTMRAQDD